MLLACIWWELGEHPLFRVLPTELYSLAIAIAELLIMGLEKVRMCQRGGGEDDLLKRGSERWIRGGCIGTWR